MIIKDTDNKEVLQSYLLTTARYRFSVYEKRILYRLVEFAQQDLLGKKINAGYSINRTLFDDRIITMPTTAFLKDEKDQNHVRVKKALQDLRNKTMEFIDGHIWSLVGIIEKPKLDLKGDIVEFEVNPKIWGAILDFAKGHRKYEIAIAMWFRSDFSMRFYELFSHQKRPTTYTIEYLKEMFEIQEKYKGRPADFIKRVVAVAKKELDEKSPFSFKYKTIKKGRKITSIMFTPYDTGKNDIEISVIPVKTRVSNSIFNYLIKEYGFQDVQIKKNIIKLVDAENKFDLYDFLRKIKTRAMESQTPTIAYTMKSIQNEIDNYDVAQAKLEIRLQNQVRREQGKPTLTDTEKQAILEIEKFKASSQ